MKKTENQLLNTGFNGYGGRARFLRGMEIDISA